MTYKIAGILIKLATQKDMERARQCGVKIVTGKNGLRLVSYWDRERNQVFISHTLEVVSPNTANILHIQDTSTITRE